MLKFVFAVVSVLALTVTLNAQDPSTLDIAAEAALVQLQEVTMQEGPAQEKLTQAKAAKATADEAFTQAKAQDDAAQKDLEKAEKDLYLFVTPPLSYTQVPGVSALSRYDAAREELKAAQKEVAEIVHFDEDHQVDIDKVARLEKANTAWALIVLEAKTLRDRLHHEYSVRFQPPLPATEEDILKEIAQSASAAKVATGKTLAEKTTAKADALKAFEEADAALKALQATRDRLLQNEVLRKGLNAVQARLGALEVTTNDGFKTVTKSVNGVRIAVKSVDKNIQAGNKILARMEGNLVKIDGRLVAIDEGILALYKLTDERTAEMLTKVSKCGLPAAEAEKLTTILTQVTALATSVSDNGESVSKAHQKLDKLLPLIEQLSKKADSSQELYVQFKDPCSNRWYYVSTKS